MVKNHKTFNNLCGQNNENFAPLFWKNSYKILIKSDFKQKIYLRRVNFKVKGWPYVTFNHLWSHT